MKKIAWYISGFIFFAGFCVVAPLIKILHWPFADLLFVIAGVAGLIFIALSLPLLYKKLK